MLKFLTRFYFLKPSFGVVNYFRIWVVNYFGFAWSISVDYRRRFCEERDGTISKFIFKNWVETWSCVSAAIQNKSRDRIDGESFFNYIYWPSKNFKGIGINGYEKRLLNLIYSFCPIVQAESTFTYWPMSAAWMPKNQLCHPPHQRIRNINAIGSEIQEDSFAEVGEDFFDEKEFVGINDEFEGDGVFAQRGDLDGRPGVGYDVG